MAACLRGNGGGIRALVRVDADTDGALDYDLMCRLGIRLPDGGPAHTACAGFGIERVAIALLATHGMAVADWPGPVRRALRLGRETV